MSSYSLQLLDFPENCKKGTLPCGPRVYIALKRNSRVRGPNKAGKKETEYIVITPECVTVAEFRYHVERLMKELETIGKQAGRFFQKDVEKRNTASSKHESACHSS
jgi:hypothetical protein